jgi:hypothetical protein
MIPGGPKVSFENPIAWKTWIAWRGYLEDLEYHLKIP